MGPWGVAGGVPAGAAPLLAGAVGAVGLPPPAPAGAAGDEPASVAEARDKASAAVVGAAGAAGDPLAGAEGAVPPLPPAAPPLAPPPSEPPPVDASARHNSRTYQNILIGTPCPPCLARVASKAWVNGTGGGWRELGTLGNRHGRLIQAPALATDNSTTRAPNPNRVSLTDGTDGLHARKTQGAPALSIALEEEPSEVPLREIRHQRLTRLVRTMALSSRHPQVMASVDPWPEL